MDERIVAVAVAPRATVAALYIAQRLAIVIAYSAIVIQTNFRGYSGGAPDSDAPIGTSLFSVALHAIALFSHAHTCKV